MTTAKKIYLAVSGGLIAVGVVLAALGFVLSGFDPEVFTASYDVRIGVLELGGVEVEDASGLPLLGQLLELGDIEIGSRAS